MNKKKEFISIQRANELINRLCSYSRLQETLSLKRFIKPDEWFQLLGQQWTGFDNISDHTPRLRKILQKAKREQLNLMMRDGDFETYNTLLPDEITIYRGCYHNNADGLSWTIDKELAQKFPFMMRYGQKNKPLLIEAKAKKSDVVFINDRNEQEIIAAEIEVINVSMLTENPFRQAGE